MASLDSIATIAFRHEFQDAGFTAGMEAAAAASNRAGAAGEKVREGVKQTSEEVRRSLPAWSAVNKAIDENAKLKAALERADRQLEARLAALRAEAAKNADVAANQARAEQRLTALRDQAVAKAREQAAAEKARWDAVGGASDKAAGGFKNLGAVAGSAGQQLQDVIIQAQMGVSPFTILAQQGSQFAGIFGPTGAMVGAGIAIASVVAGAVLLGGEMQKLDDVLKAIDADYDRLNAQAEKRIKGINDEAEAVLKLASAHAAASEASRVAEQVAIDRQRRQLEEQSKSVAKSASGSGFLSSSPAETLRQSYTSQDIAAPRGLAEMAAAEERLRSEKTLTIQVLDEYVAAIKRGMDAGEMNTGQLRRWMDAALAAREEVAKLEEGAEKLNQRQAALDIANGKVAQSTGAVGEAAAAAGRRAQGLAADLDAATKALMRLRAQALDDNFADVNAEIARTETLRLALERGGTAAYEKRLAQFDRDAAIGKKTNELREEFIKLQTATNVSMDEARKLADEQGETFNRRATQAVDGQRSLEAQVKKVAEAEREREKASRSAASEARKAAREAEREVAAYAKSHYETLRANTQGLLSLGTRDDAAAQQIAKATAGLQEANKKAAKQASDLEEKGAKEREQTAKTATDSVVRYATDSFADLFRDTGKSWKEMWDGFVGVARSAIAKIAAEAIVRPIVQPVMAALVGNGGSVAAGLGNALGLNLGGGGAVSGASGAATAAAGGVSGGGGLFSNLGTMSGLYSAGRSVVSGMGMFAPGGLANTGWGWADGVLNTSLSNNIHNFSAGEKAFRGMAGLQAAPNYTVGNAIGAGASIAGGAYGIYSGLQRGGVGGYTTAAGGAIGVAAGATSAAVGAGLLGASSTLAMLGPYGMIAAAVVMAIGALLPGAKPSNMTGSALLDLGNGAIQEFGQTGEKFSQANRDAASGTATGLYGAAQNLGRLLGGAKMQGTVVVDVGNRDGLGLRVQAPGYDSGTMGFDRDEEGQKRMNRFAIGAILAAVAPTLPAELQRVVTQVTQIPGATAEGIVEAIAKVASVTDGGKFSAYQATAASNLDFRDTDNAVQELAWVRDFYTPIQDGTKAASAFEQQMKAVTAEWQDAIDHAARLGLATDKLSEGMAKATAGMNDDRQRAVQGAVRLLESREAALQGDTVAARLIEFDAQADQQLAAWKRQLADWGLAAEQQAEQIVHLETILGRERVKAARDAYRALEDQERTRTESPVSLWARLARVRGNTLEADLLDFDVAAQGQRFDLRRSLEDAFASPGEIAGQMALLETVLGEERLKIANDYNARIADAERQAVDDRARTAAGWITGLADYATGLRTRQDSPLSATQQYWGASTDFQDVLSKALAGDGDAVRRLSGSADTFLGASRAIYGSGENYARDWNRVVDALGQIGAKGPEELTASVLQTEVRSQTEVLVGELSRLRSEVTALRTEQRLANAVPRAA